MTMRSAFFYRLSFAALNFVGIALVLAILAIFAWVGRNAWSWWRGGTSSSGTLVVENSPVQDRKRMDFAGGLDGKAVIGSPSVAVAAPPFAWEGDEELIRQAIEGFASRRDWEACVYLASLTLSRDDVDKAKKLEWVDHYFRDVVSEAILLEIEAGDLKRLHGMSGNGTVFEELPFQTALVLMNNVRSRLRREGVPEAIVDILTRALIQRIDDAFLSMAAHELIGRDSSERVGYERAESFVDELLGDAGDQRYLGRYLQACLVDLYGRWSKSDKRTFRWILSSSENMAHAKALLSAVDPKEDRLSLQEYESLAPLQRWALARFARTRLQDRGRNDFFKKFHLWREKIAPDGELTYEMTRELRREPRWTRELNRRCYDRAMTAARSAFETVTGGEPMPDKLVARMEKMVESERKLWFELVNKFQWKRLFEEEWQAALKSGEDKRSAGPNVFWKSLYRLFPASIRSDRQTLLMAVCMINRGLDPQVFLGVDKALLETYIPPEEFYGGKSQ